MAYASFHQNIGTLVMRFGKSIEGNMCSSCLSNNFWSYTLITVAVGWFGLISIVVAPIYVILNVVSCIRASSQISRALRPLS